MSSDSFRQTLEQHARRLLSGSSNKQKLVAFAVARGRIIATGYNSYVKTHPKQKLYALLNGEPNKEFLHAEIAAIVRAREPIEELHVFRVNNQGKLQNASPCPICRLAITEAGIREVYCS